MTRPMRDLRYGRFAAVYDLFGTVWTGGRIRASKLSQIEEIKTGDRVLYAGSGTGEDALAAAQKGAHVVIVELAPQMLRRTRQRFEDAMMTAEFICADAGQHFSPDGYDVVVANFFLNVFEPEAMERMARHLAGLVNRGGKMLIADFAPPSGGFLSRWGAQLHHGLPMLFFAATANQPLHHIYDYQTVLTTAGLRTQRVRYFGPWMLSISATR